MAIYVNFTKLDHKLITGIMDEESKIFLTSAQNTVTNI